MGARKTATAVRTLIIDPDQQSQAENLPWTRGRNGISRSYQRPHRPAPLKAPQQRCLCAFSWSGRARGSRQDGDDV